jgi:hypothetical protein
MDMAEYWEETVRDLLKLGNTGEKVKIYVFKRIAERLTISENKGAFRSLAEECIKEAYEKIRTGDFIMPQDWIFFVASVLGASDIFDQEEVLGDPAKLSVIQRILKAGSFKI